MRNHKNHRRLSTVASHLCSMFCLAGAATTLAVPGVTPTAFAATGTASTPASQGAPVFHLAAWKGLGNAAIIYTKPGNAGLAGGQLYTLLNVKGPSGDVAQRHFIANRVQTASFSPDGKWVFYVQNTVTKDANGYPMTTPSGWIAASDGSHRQRIWTKDWAVGAWVPLYASHTDTYSFGTTRLMQVTPRHKPVAAHILMPKNIRISGIEWNPAAQEASLNITIIPSSKQGYSDAYDVIGTWDAKSPVFHRLVTAKTGNGLVLGPWTKSGGRLFYWDDPFHSASVLSDGTTLWTIAIPRQSGSASSPSSSQSASEAHPSAKLHSSPKPQKIGTTLSDSRAVTPFGKDEAVIRMGGSRYWYQTKSVVLWQPGRVTPLPEKQGTVQNEPAISPDGQTIAFVQGEDLTKKMEQGVLTSAAMVKLTQSWWRQLELVTYDVKSHRVRTLTGAGKGVWDVFFTASGKDIVYAEGNLLSVVPSVGGERQVVAVFPGEATHTYPQAGTQSLTIADYLP